MKITKEYFNQIIKEETEKILSESFSKAFRAARKRGDKTFEYKGKTFGTKRSSRGSWARKKYLKTIARATGASYKDVKDAHKNDSLGELRKDYVISKVELGKKLTKGQFKLAKTLGPWPSSKYPTMDGDYSRHKTYHKSVMPQVAVFDRGGHMPKGPAASTVAAAEPKIKMRPPTPPKQKVAKVDKKTEYQARLKAIQALRGKYKTRAELNRAKETARKAFVAAKGNKSPDEVAKLKRQYNNLQQAMRPAMKKIALPRPKLPNTGDDMAKQRKRDAADLKRTADKVIKGTPETETEPAPKPVAKPAPKRLPGSQP